METRVQRGGITSNLSKYMRRSKNVSDHLNRAKALYELSRFAEAKASLEKARELDPEDATMSECE